MKRVKKSDGDWETALFERRSVKPELTCLEEAKEENDSITKERDEWIDTYRALLLKSRLSVLFTLLAVALICFVGGIWFTWTGIGMPSNVNSCPVITLTGWVLETGTTTVRATLK